MAADLPAAQIFEVTAKGVKLRVWRQGEGAHLVLLHGFPETIAGWREVLPRLAERFCVHAFDWPGMGGSSAPWPFGYNPLGLGELLLAFLDASGIDRAHLLGVDIGMPPALFVAATQPQRVHRLIVGDGPGLFRPGLRGLPIVALTSRFGGSMVRAMSLAPHLAARRTFRLGGTTRADRVLLDAAALNLSRPRVVGAVFRDIVRDLATVEPLLATIRAPTLVLWGGRDRLVKPRMGEEVQRAIPGARLEIVEDAGHFVHLDRPDVFAQRVLEFLGGDAVGKR